jgi:hypothetical protein
MIEISKLFIGMFGIAFIVVISSSITWMICEKQYTNTNKVNINNFDNNIVPYPLDGMIYFVETNSESDEAWIANKPIQYIDEEGYHCGWGLATLCFKFQDLGEVYFFSREDAKVNLGCKEKQL